MPSLEVSKLNSIPRGMVLQEVDGREYAVFEISGNLPSCQGTIDYIYGIWLPQSKFKRGTGLDFEKIDCSNYLRGDHDRVIHYHLPIERPNQHSF